jgi:hypothetical protein
VQTVVISLLGGPGVLKSTTAAELYAKMKRKRLKVELVREVAKDYAWAGHKIGPFEQISILGEQIKRESSLYGKVDYIVTDSPVMLGAFYFEHNHKEIFMSKMVSSYYKFSKQNGVKFKNYLLPRTVKYQQDGRFENESQAKQVDMAIEDYLNYNWYAHDKVDMTMGEDKWADWIMEELETVK